MIQGAGATPGSSLFFVEHVARRALRVVFHVPRATCHVQPRALALYPTTLTQHHTLYLQIRMLLQLWTILRDRPAYIRPYHILKTLLAVAYLKCFPGIEIIAVAGSVGKTTTKEAIASILQQQFKVKYSFANLDPIFNIPRTILSLRPGDQKLILEFSIDHPGDMDTYLRIVSPNVAVLTRISIEHSEFLGNLATIAQEEGKVITTLRHGAVAVLNDEDVYTRKMAEKTQTNIIWYGWDKTSAQVWATDFQENDQGSKFTLHLGGKSAQISWRLAGMHSVNAALAATGVGSHCGMPLDQIKRGLEALIPLPARMNILQYNGATIIDDAYNASPAAVIAALETLLARAGTGRSIAILATMKELGDVAEEAHREVGKAVARTHPSLVVLWGEHTQYIHNQAVQDWYPQAQILTIDSYGKILTWLKQNLQQGDTVLIKGSRHHIHLERIALDLQGKSTNIQCPLCPECR